MKLVGIALLLVGFAPLIYLSCTEKDKQTHWKIMIGAFCGALATVGLIFIIM